MKERIYGQDSKGRPAPDHRPAGGSRSGGGRYEEILKKRIEEAAGPDRAAGAECRRRWDGLAKPVDGLGRFEDLIVKIAGIQATADVDISKRAAVVMCADHGVTAERVTQTDSSVTAAVARALAEGRSTLNAMAAAAHADVYAVDMGMDVSGGLDGVRDMSLARGTGDIGQSRAMTREQAALGILRGVREAEDLAARGYRLLAAGEMGIGNTTAASAVLCAMTGAAPDEVTGRGAGLPDSLLSHKIEIVRQAVRINAPDPEDPLDVLSRVGGFDIAGMTGLFIGGALARLPVIIDGFISGVSALLARTLCPLSGEYMIASHAGREKASDLLFEELGLHPVIYGDMALGEATGAVMLMPLLDVALSLYRNGEVFADIDVEPYERF